MPQWTVGQAGVRGRGNGRFRGPAGVDVDSNGRSYVADSGNNRVQIFNSDGSYYTTLGNADCNPDNGIGNTEFCWPRGVAIGPGDAIYVADTGNNRVQVFNSSRIYQDTLGETEVPGSDNNHFNEPMGVTVDASGNIYVADTGNNRVQVFNSSRVYQRTLGTTGEWGDDFDYFSEPNDVAVDASGRIYVADSGNKRIQVFDSSGAYLTTIGGSWGSRTGELRSPGGVDVDSAGNVYVADRDNSRIQKFARGVEGWTQVNLNGFGNRSNEAVLSLAFFGDTLYAGTVNFDTGGEIWRMGSPWTAVITGGLGYTYNVGIDHLIEFKGNLYAGTWADEVNGGEVWRSSNSLDWTRVVSQGFGDPTNGEVFRFAVFSDTLYASTDSYTDTHGAEIWRSSSGNAGDWTRVVANGFGNADNGFVPSLETFNGYLYVGAFNWDVAGQTSTGGEVWRSNTGDDGSWSQVNTGGFGDSDNIGVASFAVFNGYLYAGTQNWTTGGQVWRCSTASGCDENSDWGQVVGDGFGDGNNSRADALIVSDNYLYCVTRNDQTGVEVWRSDTGNSGDWEQVGPDGFGDSNNYCSYWDNAVAVGSLYIGTWNWANGGEVWQLGGGQSPGTGPVYLPIVLKSYR